MYAQRHTHTKEKKKKKQGEKEFSLSLFFTFKSQSPCTCTHMQNKGKIKGEKNSLLLFFSHLQINKDPKQILRKNCTWKSGENACKG
jgi:uncharacterized protein YdeI (YjbR/CyaY-like superfamily)